MKLPSTPKQMGLWLAGLAVLTVGLSLVLIPTPNPTSDAQQVQTEWQLDNIYLFEHPQQVYNQLQQRQAWGKTARDNQADTSVAQSWRLAGITQSGRQRFALLLDTTNNKVQRYAEGDMLDNGGQLIKIHADAVEIKLAGDINTAYLHPRNNVKK